jgi:hypothetical protein
VDAGEAVAVFEPVEEAPALQVYDVAPLAVSCAVDPAQIVGELTIMVGIALTVTVETAVLVQVPFAPVTVYVVVIVGEASAVAVPVAVAPADQV